MQEFLAGRGERFCLIGGMALQRWGEPRVTRDVDVTLLAPLGAEGPTVDRLLSKFEPRIEGAREFALRNRVLLLRSGGGIGIDVALGGIPFEERCVARSSDWTFAPGLLLRTCSAEDLVVMKAFAGRNQDWVDLQGVLVRQRKTLDWTLVLRELESLAALREDQDSVEKLRQLKARIDRGA